MRSVPAAFPLPRLLCSPYFSRTLPTQTGTPIQNQLSEYFSMFSLACPGLLGTQASFNKVYQNPVLAGRDAGATDKQMEAGAACERALVEVCSRFMLRRTSTVLKKYLPPKTQMVVFVKMAPLQLALYRGFLASAPVSAALEGRKLERAEALSTLPAITALKKLCCHPSLVYGLAGGAGAGAGGGVGGGGGRSASGGLRAAAAAGMQRMSASGPASSSHVVTGFEGLGELFAAAYPPFTPGRVTPLHSGKVAVVEALLRSIRAVAPKDKVVLVSNYTETLDLMGAVCEANRWATLRLDGSNSVKSRQPLVDSFNAVDHPSFVLLLSSKAGGVG
jgi:SNF2 family DNA or RNA helicase